MRIKLNVIAKTINANQINIDEKIKRNDDIADDGIAEEQAMSMQKLQESIRWRNNKIFSVQP